MTDAVTVHKLDSAGSELWSYPTRLLARGSTWIRLEAHFDHHDVVFHGLTLRRGDRMVETFYADRWYNVFAIHEGAAGALKGWYCNITRPARIESQDVSAEDLALDLLVYPEGGGLVLDEDEFAALGLSPDEQMEVRRALQELRDLVARRQGPFAEPDDDSAPA